MMTFRRSIGIVRRLPAMPILGFALVVAWPQSGSALPKDPVYNQCGCYCDGPTGGSIDVYNNTGGYSCDVYNNHTCSYIDPQTGSVNQGKTKYCGAYKPGGTRAALMIPRTNRSGAVMSRGAEPSSSNDEESLPAVLMSRPGNAMMNCSCEQGEGSCSVTSADGKSSTCHKGEGDTCTGACSYPKGTVSGTR